jgi:hypothetical protein
MSDGVSNSLTGIDTINLPSTFNLAIGEVVPIPTSPFNAVVTIELFPSTTVFEPKPVASCPITI